MTTNVKDLGQITIETINSWPSKYEMTAGNFFCKVCNTMIKQTTCFVSIHAKEFEPKHTGSGKVVNIFYPYCPNCDGTPELIRACFHVEAFNRQKILVDIVNLPIIRG